MADLNNKNRNNAVDDAGIRLAPVPMQNSSCHMMPAVRQDFVLTPRLEIDGPEGDTARKATSENDFQPKHEDISKRWKRRRRTKNMIIGILMLASTMIVILPYILSAAGVNLKDFPFRYVPQRFGALHNIIQAFVLSFRSGWKGVGNVWLNAAPDIILLIGLVFLAINVLKSVFALFGTTKPVKYTTGAAIYLLAVLAMLIASLVGVEIVGIEKIDFLRDFIHGHKTSDVFSLVVLSACYFLASLVCTIIGADKMGYLR